MRFPISLLVIFFSLLEAHALPTFWNLPINLNDSNTRINFEGDSTWHAIHGKTSGVTGKAWLEDPRDFTTLRGEIVLPVSSLDTGDKSCNETLCKVMASETYKEVKFSLKSASNLCNPIEMTEGAKCMAAIRGDLTIRKTTKEIEIPVEIVKTTKAFKITGKFKFDWRDYEVEDPSILIAAVDPIVEIIAEITL